MRLNKLFIGSLLGFAVSSTARIIATDETPLIGPSFISNFDPSSSKAINNAKSTFPGLIEKLFKSGELNHTDLAFTVDVFSAATNESLYSYSHVGPMSKRALTSGKLDDNTISRIGSVTKLFTVYAIIAKAGMEVFSHPVTKYLPELAGNSTGNPLDRISWDEITVGALASHQAGSGGITDFFMAYQDPKDPKSLEFRAEDLLEFFRDKRLPVVAPYHSAIYSDGGFAILGQVLARLSGQSVTDAFEEILWKPLGMNSTSTQVPTGSNLNVIDRLRISNESAWGSDVEIVASTGSVYSSTADLRRAGLSILNSELISGPTTSEWMKPRSATGSLVELVGAPWEISRLEIPVMPASNRTRISDLYTKAGGNIDYTAIFALSPDQGIGYSILLAGDTATPARWPLRDVVGETFIPAAEHAAAENAARNLAGTFVDEENTGNNITLTVDRGHPGLGIRSFWLEGKNALSGPHYRIYPTGLTSTSSSLSSLYQTKGSISIAHRMATPFTPLNPRAEVEGGKGGLFDNSFTWMNLDSKGPIDLFVFNLEDGKLVSVEFPLTGTVMKRKA
ncbi:hypothetical protein N7532_001096 [Penicillium argentinense]|uniref:Beta-lactamase-related domain-containing protein n=1 Tax=Penicillium argentinense TaxID=1131581 RepID=A0A9W9G1U4_9EURO|nr:uncharacterized protein N7532_001096 [Penicillium argentinense]KAJ5110561.1 hypothetical protein N7532_001096 [Penicillium argentinense]